MVPQFNQIWDRYKCDFLYVCRGSSTTLEPAETPQVFVDQADANKPKKGKCDHLLCAHCRILGHVKDKCYKLHGYPLAIHQ